MWIALACPPEELALLELWRGARSGLHRHEAGRSRGRSGGPRRARRNACRPRSRAREVKVGEEPEEEDHGEEAIDEQEEGPRLAGGVAIDRSRLAGTGRRRGSVGWRATPTRSP